jgi:hypothetical protein
MKHSIFKKLALITLLCGAFYSCKKDPKPNEGNGGTITDKSGSVVMQFKNTVGDEPLQKNKTYTNPHGELYSVNKFMYYITNIELIKENDEVIAIPESYYLINFEDVSSQSIELNDVRGGKYKAISFLIGVDAARNTSGAQEGALDVSHGMFWDWNSGYIMVKLEGESMESGSAGKRIIYHAGGFSDFSSAVRKVTLPFNASMSLNGDKLNVHLKTDVQKIFKGDGDLKISETSVIMNAGSKSTLMANNYKNMITIESVGK